MPHSWTELLAEAPDPRPPRPPHPYSRYPYTDGFYDRSQLHPPSYHQYPTYYYRCYPAYLSDLNSSGYVSQLHSSYLWAQYSKYANPCPPPYGVSPPCPCNRGRVSPGRPPRTTPRRPSAGAPATNNQDAGWSAMGVEARASMPAAAERARSPSPGHQCKRRRLSRLLDKLAVQLRRQCPPPAWLRPAAPAPAPAPAPDAPLDLTVRAAPLPPPPPPRHACPDCGQAFALQDRLAKHVASRHRGRTPDAARAYVCDVCQRRFARSDMLTRHARLHSGVKPYACGACGQVFSRSDHLATHQRTHTGEKPYRCPACPYAACRRDMITRHMRTHARRAPPA